MDIRTLCLGLLTLRDASGYEIKKSFENDLSDFYEASFGSIYPALSKLTAEGLLTCTAQPQEKRPDKKVYRITPAGRLAFLDALAKPPGRDHVRSDFLATMLFADLLPARHLAQLIDERLVMHRRSILEQRALLKDVKSAGKRFIIDYGLAWHEAAIAYIEENRHLIESEALLTPGGGS